MQMLLIQTVAGGAADAPEKLSILSLLFEKGGLEFMIPLLILSIIAIYIFIERYIKIWNASRIDRDFLDRIEQNMLAGNISAATDLCRNNDTPIARMIEKGIDRIGKPLRSIEVAIENEGNIELLKLEKRLAALAMIAGAAPMIGFLGTVTGMIEAFYNMSNATGNIDPGMLAGGIYKALITTAAGLTIGIIAFIGYNILVSMVQKVIFEMEYNTVKFVDFLQKPA